MEKAPYVSNDSERLENLQSYRILDSGDEKEFDDLVLLATEITQCPIGFISFVDSSRLWLKAKIGVSAQEISRDVSICGHAIAGKDFFEVKDIHKDERFFDNDLCSTLNLRYYGGIPIISDEGFGLGVLCVMHNRPNTLNRKQIKLLKALAHQVRNSLNLRKAYNLLSQQQKNLVWLGKLTMLGEMSASLTHEMNNIIFILNTKLSVLKKKISVTQIPASSVFMSDLEKLESVSARLSSIIKGVKVFSRKENAVEKELVKVNKLLEDTLIFCLGRINLLGVELILDVEQGLNIKCSATLISQVLLNLIQNSLDAVEGQRDKWIKVSVKRKGSLVEFSVQDSGHGIDIGIQEKILQPFFTTKDKGKGTGLGLSVSKSILDAHGGVFFYDSKEPHTRFVFSFPADPDSVE